MTHTLDEVLHRIAREYASRFSDIDKKQLRFNEIVTCAKKFYPQNAVAGVQEIIESCSKQSPLYVPKQPLYKTLDLEYGWML